ncbi:MAG: MBL fold metallo-hydrolase [Treponema sp.]|jgi:phosphoribosyl 1,2-cyclic phosphate phosphodiesterase|nr:MBL fold metallo-hydrolase [Treponema sp.]
MKLTILGSGTSHGVPVIGCACPVCISPDSRDRRMRCSLYIEGPAGERAVIDTGPEFRLQALKAGMERLDAVFLTHAHADHIHGLDDIRPLSREKPIPVYGNGPVIAEFRKRFAYIFRITQTGGGKPRIATCIADGPVRLGSLVFTPLPVKHGTLDILGWKIEQESAPEVSAVYLTDTSFIGGETMGIIGRPDLLIIGALRGRPHETHFTFGEALETAAGTGTPRAFLTHICHEHSHRQIEEYCRSFVEKNAPGLKAGPAWDGLGLTL